VLHLKKRQIVASAALGLNTTVGTEVMLPSVGGRDSSGCGSLGSKRQRQATDATQPKRTGSKFIFTV
jgi:hypothetical protein